MHQTVTVKACYDPDAGVWFVEESDLPGLSAEAATIEALAEKLPGMIIDLIEENGTADGIDVPIELVAHRSLSAKMPAAA